MFELIKIAAGWLGGFLASCASFAGELLWMALIAIFIQNTIFSRAMGTSTALFVVRKRREKKHEYNIFVFGAILSVISAFASTAAYFLLPILQKYEVTRFMPLAFVAAICVIYLLLLFGIRMLLWEHRKIILPSIHLAVFNSTVLGAMLLLQVEHITTLAQAIGFGLGMGLGFMGSTIIIAVGHNYLYSSAIPKSFRGFPIMLIYIGILSMAFYGIIGGHELLS